MTRTGDPRGAATVGSLGDLDGIEAAAVRCFRLWADGPDSQAEMWCEISRALGAEEARKALKSFEHLCSLCACHGRRTLMCHAVRCPCLGADEACFARFVATAVDGAQEDALLMATLLVRVDVAPLVASRAAEFGLALRRMQLRGSRVEIAPAHATLH
jgi:hypothetical protein